MKEKPKYKSLKGMPDILPEQMRIMRWVEKEARSMFHLFGYSEIGTPLLEATEVFARSIGENTDIVEKEMYSFVDRGGKHISLRPEGTASVIRSYIEQCFFENKDLIKLFYTGPMFRGERPQKGRLRQFHQIGVEAIGFSHPQIDAELIFSLNQLLTKLKISGFTVLVNSLGCSNDRKIFEKELKKYLKTRKSDLCENCQKRSEKNVLRVLDCKRELCRKVMEKAPKIASFLCDGCAEDFKTTRDILASLKVAYQVKEDLVRGLDYYTGVIFEVIHPALGAQDALAAGGRYDNLSVQMGGPEVGASGYALGMERLLLAIDEKDLPEYVPGVLIVYIDKELRKEAFELALKLLSRDIGCEIDHSGRSFKGQMRKANREKRPFIILMGSEEVKQKKCLVKNMKTGEQELLAFEKCVDFFGSLGQE